MTINYQASTERKKLVAAAAAHLGASSSYAGMPSASYIVGPFTITREGALTGPDNRELIAALAAQGFQSTEEAYDTESEAHAEEAAEEAKAPNRLTIEMPLAGFDPVRLDVLRKLVVSKENLLKMALDADTLPIQIEQDRVIFPWFPCDDNAVAYAQLIAALCRTAQEKSRINARPRQAYPNPKFTMRCWLTTTLGLVGDDYRQIRRLLCAPLSGNSAWSRGCDPRKTAKTELVENGDD